MQEKNKSKLSLILSMTIFGTIGIFRKYIPLPSSILALARAVIGTIFLVIFVLVKKEKIAWNTVKKNLPVLCISGAAIGFNWILLFESYQYTSVATATLCYYMAPVFVILASPFLFGEKLTVKKWICVSAALLGMIFVSGILKSDFTGGNEFRGVLLGLAAAILYASVVMMNKKIGEVGAYEKTIIQLGAGAVALLPYTLMTEEFTTIAFSQTMACMLVFVGIVHTGIAYALYFGALANLEAQTAALFSYIDPVVAIILSAMILHENMGIWEMIGAVLVLGSAVMNELPEKK